MEITVKVPDELAAQARAHGMPLETYVEKLLAQEVELQTLGARQLPAVEQVRDWVNSLAQFSDKIPRLPDTISREWIYQDHA